MSKVNFFVSLVMVSGVIVLVVLLLYPSFKEYKRNQRINIEIEKLKQEAEQLKENNAELSEKIEYFKTEAYKERIAKERLNLQKQDEQIVAVRPSISKIKGENDQEEERDVEKTEERFEYSNYQKWFKYFFENL